jgi:AhpD family alkylhydroperoxidase
MVAGSTSRTRDGSPPPKESAMHQFTIHTAESAPPGSKQPLALLQQRIGFVPNLAGAMATSPTLVESFVGLLQRLQASSLTGLEREVVGLTVSFKNACTWSMAAHSTLAAAQGASGEVLEALRSGRELPDPRLQALHAFTRALLRSRGHLDGGAVEAVRKAGYTTEQALEVIAQAACTSMANWAANLADPPVDQAFEPSAGRRWRRSGRGGRRPASPGPQPPQAILGDDGHGLLGHDRRPSTRLGPRPPARNASAWRGLSR